MLENLDGYRQRTGFMWQSLPGEGVLSTGAGLMKKVDGEGAFRPFFGDTVIFSLAEDDIRWLAQVQDALYEELWDCLAQRLSPDTFHITLHDLSNSPAGWPSGMPGNNKRVNLRLDAARAHLPATLRLRSTCVFSMVNTSLVMGFEPLTEADCAALMTLYHSLDEVVRLSYPLTLHATLAYYRPGVYGQETLNRLNAALSRIGRERRELALTLGGLSYAEFDSMNRYQVSGRSARL